MDFDRLTENHPIVKIILIGNSGVGKSNLIMRFCHNKFSPDPDSPTIAVQFYRSEFDHDGERHSMHIWDTGGQERFESITTIYYRGARGVGIVFDLSDAQSFADVQKWYGRMCQNCAVPLLDRGVPFGSTEIEKESRRNRQVPPGLSFVLVGNKSDLDRAVRQDEIDRVQQEWGCEYIETSAKEGTNVENVFQTLIDGMMFEDRDASWVRPDSPPPAATNKCRFS